MLHRGVRVQLTNHLPKNVRAKDKRYFSQYNGHAVVAYINGMAVDIHLVR